MFSRFTKTSCTLASLVAMAIFTPQQAQAAEVLVQGSFTASGFNLSVTPDPFELDFSVVITIDDATLASNGFFEINTVLDSIGPNPLTIGTESFTADQINVRVERLGSELGPEFNTIGVTLGIDEINSIPGGANDFRAAFGNQITASADTVPQTVLLFDDISLANGSGTGFSSVQSGSTTLTLVPEPTSLACWAWVACSSPGGGVESLTNDKRTHDAPA